MYYEDIKTFLTDSSVSDIANDIPTSYIEHTIKFIDKIILEANNKKLAPLQIGISNEDDRLVFNILKQAVSKDAIQESNEHVVLDLWIDDTFEQLDKFKRNLENKIRGNVSVQPNMRALFPTYPNTKKYRALNKMLATVSKHLTKNSNMISPYELAQHLPLKSRGRNKVTKSYYAKHRKSFDKAVKYRLKTINTSLILVGLQLCWTPNGVTIKNLHNIDTHGVILEPENDF